MAIAAEPVIRSNPPGFIRLCIAAGLAAGFLDAIYFSVAALLKGNSPVQVLQGIAGFWLGKAALNSGIAGATLGLVTHFALATIMAAGFIVLRFKTHLLPGLPAAAGLAWGAFLYMFMYLVVLPLRWPSIFPVWNGWTSVFDVLVHLAVGLAIALAVNAQRNRATAPLSP